MMSPDDVVSVSRFADTEPELVAVRPQSNGLAVISVEADRWAEIPLGTGFLGAPSAEPFSWLSSPPQGTQLVASPSGDFVCGGQHTVGFDGAVLAGSVDSCGVIEGTPVVCDPDCVAVTPHDITPLPWVGPTRIVGDHALIDGRVVAPDGSQPFGITGADDAAVSRGWAAWIDDGQVFVEGPYGVSGPLVPTVANGAAHSETVVPTDFYADEIHIGSYWGYITVFAVAHDGLTSRVAIARIDP
jgi:hypothetical protein